jgi:hypothetical protein
MTTLANEIKEVIQELKYESELLKSNFLIKNNDIEYIIKQCLIAAEESTFEVYYQPNLDFYWKMEVDELSTYESYKERFEDYCNYFDKHRVPHIKKINKKIYNYTKKQLDSPEIHIEYPSDKKMILVVENFNFWDKQSQYYFAKLVEKNKNIIIVGQIRTDFEFAIKHIDLGIRYGKGGFHFYEE